MVGLCRPPAGVVELGREKAEVNRVSLFAQAARRRILPSSVGPLINSGPAGRTPTLFGHTQASARSRTSRNSGSSQIFSFIHLASGITSSGRLRTPRRNAAARRLAAHVATGIARLPTRLYERTLLQVNHRVQHCRKAGMFGKNTGSRIDRVVRPGGKRRPQVVEVLIPEASRAGHRAGVTSPSVLLSPVKRRGRAGVPTRRCRYRNVRRNRAVTLFRPHTSRVQRSADIAAQRRARARLDRMRLPAQPSWFIAD